MFMSVCESELGVGLSEYVSDSNSKLNVKSVWEVGEV